MDDFIWGNLNAIYLALLVPLIVLLFYYGERRRRNNISMMVEKSMQGRFISPNLKKKRNLRFLLITLGIIFSVISLMRPKMGFYWEKIEQKGIDIVIAVDLSKSMLATDISPNRFQRSVFEIKNLLKILDGDRIALVPFTSRSFIQCPLTVDYKSFNMFIDMLEPGLLAGGGTSLNAALEKSIEAFDEKYKKHRILIIMTDGESHDENLDSSIAKAKEKGIRIFTIGFGSEEGAPITVADQSGNKEYIKDENGDIVLSKLNGETLKRLAIETNGAYLPANLTVFSLEEIYKKEIKKLEGRMIDASRKKRFKDRFYIPLFLSFTLFFFAFLLGS